MKRQQQCYSLSAKRGDGARIQLGGVFKVPFRVHPIPQRFLFAAEKVLAQGPGYTEARIRSSA
jgi:hypothetical protein